MASPDQIWYRESLTTPIVAKGLIDGLPFTSEGYARAKLILPSRYDKPREAAAAHIYCVTSLPVLRTALLTVSKNFAKN